MYKRIILILILFGGLIIETYCQNSQTTSCGQDCNISYKLVNNTNTSNPDRVYLYLNNGFNDVIKVLADDSLLYSGTVVTNQVLSHAITFNVERGKYDSFSINLPEKCLTIPLEEKYQYITVSWWRNAWYVVYTDKEPVFE